MSTKAIERSLVIFDACGMDKPSCSLHLNSIWMTNVYQKGKREFDNTIDINTRILVYIRWLISSVLTFNIYVKFGAVLLEERIRS